MRVAATFVAAFVCSAVLAALPVPRTLSFEERVSAQAAIERVYYAHQPTRRCLQLDEARDLTNHAVSAFKFRVPRLFALASVSEQIGGVS